MLDVGRRQVSLVLFSGAAVRGIPVY